MMLVARQALRGFGNELSQCRPCAFCADFTVWCRHRLLDLIAKGHYLGRTPMQPDVDGYQLHPELHVDQVSPGLIEGRLGCKVPVAGWILVTPMPSVESGSPISDCRSSERRVRVQSLLTTSFAGSQRRRVFRCASLKQVCEGGTEQRAADGNDRRKACFHDDKWTTRRVAEPSPARP
jgi:hypothetical protein